jgi:hypothetical protein
VPLNVADLAAMASAMDLNPAELMERALVIAIGAESVRGKVSLAEVGKLLGHVDPKTTQKYAHLETKPATSVLDALPAPNVLPKVEGEGHQAQVRGLGKRRGQRSHTPKHDLEHPDQ